VLPYFRVSVELNAPDDIEADDRFRDQQCLKLSLAREIGIFGEGDEAVERSRTNNEIEIVDKLVEAIVWLSNRTPTEEPDSFLSFLMTRLAGESPKALEEFLNAETETGDADWGDLVRKIAKKCEETGI